MRVETVRLEAASRELQDIYQQINYHNEEIRQIRARLRSMDSLRAFDEPLRRRIEALEETFRGVVDSSRTLSRVSTRDAMAEERAIETAEGARIRYPAGKAGFVEVKFDRALLRAEG